MLLTILDGTRCPIKEYEVAAAAYNRSVQSLVKIPKTDPKRPSKEYKNISFMETKLQTRARED